MDIKVLKTKTIVIKIIYWNQKFRKDEFIKLLKSSSFFLAVFDKNKDRIVTEVRKEHKKWVTRGDGSELDVRDDALQAG